MRLEIRDNKKIKRLKDKEVVKSRIKITYLQERTKEFGEFASLNTTTKRIICEINRGTFKETRNFPANKKGEKELLEFIRVVGI